MSGLEVLAWIRRNVHTHVPVIFLTTRTEEKHIVEEAHPMWAKFR
jgi:DNA-binding response OmpR family regulator